MKIYGNELIIIIIIKKYCRSCTSRHITMVIFTILCSLHIHVCFLSAETYELQVREDHKMNEKIGTLELEDRDQIRNKEPIFTISADSNKMFNIELNPDKDGNLMLKQVGGSCGNE